MKKLDRGVLDLRKFARTSTAVVWALRTWETILGPAIWGTVDIEQSVLLLEAEPGFRILGLFHNLGSMVAVVGLVGSAVVVIALSKDDDVIATAEWILEDGGRPQVDVGVTTGSLVGRRAIEIPDSQLTDIGDFFIDGLWNDD